MGSVNLVVIVESARTLITRQSDEDTNQLHVPSLIAVGAALGTSSILSGTTVLILVTGVKFLLFLYCFGYRHASSQVRMLWEDHRNDLFINGFGEYRVRTGPPSETHAVETRQVFSCPQVGASSGGVSVVPSPVSLRPAHGPIRTDLDPMGAIIVRCSLPNLAPSLGSAQRTRNRGRGGGPRPTVSNRMNRMLTLTRLAQIAFGVILSWSRTIYHQFELLAGKSAPHDFLQLLIYKAMTFSDEIEKVDTVRAYHVRFLLPDLSLPVVLFDGGALTTTRRAGRITMWRWTW